MSYKNSLNFLSRKKEQAKQIEDNIMMIKKIHCAQPTIKVTEFRNHEKQAKKLKKIVSTGDKRQSIVQAARELILSQELHAQG